LVERALLVITHCFLVTPHHPSFANGCMPVPFLATLTAANIYSSLQYLVLAICFNAGNWAFSARIRVGLCRMLDMDF
jgi:hypothetical protein